MNRQQITRRRLLKGAAGSAFAFTYIPQRVWGANERVRLGCIGIGGKGSSDVADLAAAGADIVALCDVDDNRRVRKRKDAREMYPDASFDRDFRVMLDKNEKRLDAVSVSTPDHTHCHAAVTAMRMGKHVYCQKPLSYSIGEARLMADTAKKYKVATQMGNQAHAGEPIRRAVEWIRAGVIGKVQEVHAWTNRPIWPQGLAAKPKPEAIPAGLDWDLWLGPVGPTAYSSAYCPFAWRGWWDFGTGALGDMGCHIMDMPYWALDLGYPTRVSASSKGNTVHSGPTAARVTYEFAAGKYNHDLKFNWYDGDNMPAAEVLSGSGMAPDQVAKKFDLVVIGDAGKMFFKRTSTDWVITPDERGKEFKAPAPTIPRVANEDVEWLTACQGGPAALSNFSRSGPFTEVVLLGNLAIRTGKPLDWDGEKMKATNCPEASQYVHRAYRKGWELPG
ncbi:MAG: Gfo/Idh/MocA family oxidoreductase [Pirellulaceae bacterium]|nr:Gfo/Idh/MocA family oxidoreductase [Pirellulaceae bacterium]